MKKHYITPKNEVIKTRISTVVCNSPGNVEDSKPGVDPNDPFNNKPGRATL